MTTHAPAGNLQLYTAPRWMRRALCKDADPSLFHPEPGEDNGPRVDAAKRICSHCPVRRACLNWAFEKNDRFAVLGGTTPNQRTRMKNTLRRKLGRVRQ